MDGPAYEAIASAMKDAYGTPMSTLGQRGSIPLCNVFAETYADAELIMIGVEEPAALIHAPNESVAPAKSSQWHSPRRSSCSGTPPRGAVSSLSRGDRWPSLLRDQSTNDESCAGQCASR